MHPFLIVSPHESDGGHIIGRDPRTISKEEWEATMPDPLIGMRAIRAKCIDCCGGSYSEVLKCTAVDCSLWPLRMGKQPKALRAARKGEEDDTQE